MICRLLPSVKGLYRNLLLLLLALRHPLLPGHIKMLLAAAVLYLISPLDLIPDTLPVVGLLDDAAIFPTMVWGITCLLPAAVRRDSEHRIKQMDAKLPYILAFAATLFFLWVAIVVWGIYSLIFK